MKTNSYSGRINLLSAVGCVVDGEARISAIKDEFVCLENADILWSKVANLRVKIKGHFKGKWDKVKFKWKVYLYDHERKVGLKNVLFL